MDVQKSMLQKFRLIWSKVSQTAGVGHKRIFNVSRTGIIETKLILQDERR